MDTAGFVDMLTVGVILNASISRQQVEFDKLNPVMQKEESELATFLQAAAYYKFDMALSKYKKEGGDIAEADILELRVWAPNIHCAMMNVHDQLTKEYGIFFTILLSGGLISICPGKLFYVALLVRKMDLEKLGG